VTGSDVGVTMNLTDVRNKTGLTDYSGELQVNSSVRITDKRNGHSGFQPGTVQDTTFPMTAGCVTTASTTVGSTCSLSSTFNAVVAGAIVSGKRAIWELGQVIVNDGGADGVVSTTPNTTFERQGIFTP